MDPYFDRLLNNVVPVAEEDRNAIARDFVEAAQHALGVPHVDGFNAKPFHEAPGSSTSPTTPRPTSARPPRWRTCTP